MKKHTGWLFDLYAHPTKGIVLWLIGEDGKPYRFHQDFETVFYAYGSFQRLHELGVTLRAKHSRQDVRLERVTKEDLFAGLREVMGIAVSNVTIYKNLFQEVYDEFSDLVFYNVDIPLTVRYAAAYDIFMMACCEVLAEVDGGIINIRALDTPYELDPKLPHLKVLTLRPDTDPSYKPPQYLIAKFGKSHMRTSLDKPCELINLLNSVLVRLRPGCDPNILRRCMVVSILARVGKENRHSI